MKAGAVIARKSVMIAIGVAILTLSHPTSSRAASLSVGPGDVTAFVAAITAANDDGLYPGRDSIDLAPGSVYILTAINNISNAPNGLPVITSDITINGNGATIVRDPAAPAFRFFHVVTSKSLTLNDLTLQNGDAAGGLSGAIHNQGTLTLNHAILSGNKGNSGGAIDNEGGNLTISQSTFSANISVQWGGAISDGGISAVTRSTFTSNVSGDRGGAIATGNQMAIADSSFSDNSSAGLGGGIYNYGQLTITNSNFSNNLAADGGAIDNDSGSLQVSGSNFTTNRSTLWGGALSLDGTNSIADSTISGNSASCGGGLNTTGGTLSINRSSISNNTATELGGGLYIIGALNWSDGVLSNNTAPVGGGFYSSGISAIHYLCITGNSATSVVNNSTAPLEATQDWWGSVDGPGGAGPGSGDSVSANVTFTPFLSSAASACAPTPPQTIQNMIILIGTFNLDTGTATSLTTKLQAALSSLSSGQVKAAINALQAFVHEVQAQAGKHLTQAQADQLVALAQAVIHSLSASQPQLAPSFVPRR